MDSLLYFTKIVFPVFNHTCSPVPEIADIEQDFNDWRNGPGSYWYDLANVPKNAKSYDYGFRLSKVKIPFLLLIILN